MIVVEVNHDTMRAEDAQQGWVCPKCETPVAPHKESCPKCTKQEVKESAMPSKQVLMG